MATKYCTKCGSKIEYLGSLPKFCSACGVDFGSFKRVVKNSIAAKKSNVLSDDETDASYVPSINKLQYDIEPFDLKTLNLGDVVKRLEQEGLDAKESTEEER